MRANNPLIVFSHLRWDFVYQRPQQLLSRLARERRVIFVEEPIHDHLESFWESNTPEHNVTVYRPHLSAGGPAFGDEQMPALKALLSDLVEREELSDYSVWLYTPMALPLAKTLKPKAVIYDCMDALSHFRFAPPELVQREADLLDWADVVFTGGPSLYRAKDGRHPNLHLFSSSVDADHFRQALWVEEAEDQAALPHPRLGFFGVIDERMDLDILAALAGEHPEWQIVMVGPVVKIDPATLPKYPNLYFIGQRSYKELPRYLAGWDVCLLPFARNESTHFISPTKTLEYMAAELPIVSAPITDVAEPYGDIVYLGEGSQAFVEACERALAASPQERAERTARMRAVLARTSWDATAGAISKLIRDVEEHRAVPLGKGEAASIGQS